MKKRAWKGLAIAAAAITLGAGLLFAGCDTQADGTDALSEVYAQAVELGYEGTLEDFIAQLRGEDGKDGADGAPGAPGKDGEDGKDGAPGKDGVGISSATVNGEGHLILWLTDGNTVDCGVVTGEAGAQGVGIRQIAFVGEELVITLSDGTLINCGRIPDCAHVWSAWETQLAPTCTGIGYQTRSCGLCQRWNTPFCRRKGTPSTGKSPSSSLTASRQAWSCRSARSAAAPARRSCPRSGIHMQTASARAAAC